MLEYSPAGSVLLLSLPPSSITPAPAAPPPPSLVLPYWCSLHTAVPAGAEEHSLAEEDALPHHWPPCPSTKGGACGVQADHGQPAAGQCQGGTQDQAQPARQPLAPQPL